MRITDNGGDDDSSSGAKPSFMDSIKARSQVKPAETGGTSSPPPTWERATGTPAWEQEPKVSADVQSAKLKQLLGKIKQS